MLGHHSFPFSKQHHHLHCLQNQMSFQAKRGRDGNESLLFDPLGSFSFQSLPSKEKGIEVTKGNKRKTTSMVHLFHAMKSCVSFSRHRVKMFHWLRRWGKWCYSWKSRIKNVIERQVNERIKRIVPKSSHFHSFIILSSDALCNINSLTISFVSFLIPFSSSGRWWCFLISLFKSQVSFTSLLIT